MLANRIHGVDVSQFQGTMDWDKTWNQNARFVYVRASRSGLGKDTAVDVNVPGAKNRGLLTGVYHHSSPILNDQFTDPIVDADSFVDTAGQYMGSGYLRPVVDVEEDATLNQNGYDINTWVAAFINRVQQRVGVAPMVYTTGSFGEFFLNATTVAASPDVWAAIQVAASDPITTNSQPTFNGQVGLGAWRNTTPTPQESWDFWQYSGVANGKGALYGAGGNADIDLDVFNGDSIDALKQQFIVGSAHIPTLLPFVLDGNGFVQHTGALFDWTDSAGAVAYDVYLDNMTTPAATNLTQSQWTGPMMLGGTHTWRVVAKGRIADDDTHVSSPTGTFVSQDLPFPGAPSAPTPNNVVVNTKPVTLDWADSPNTLTYDVFLGTNPTPSFSNLTVSQVTGLSPLDGTRLWRVVARNPRGTTSSAQWSYTLDTTPPTATVGTNGVLPARDATTFDFSVTYADVTTAIDANTLGDNDVLVTGPNGFSQSATLTSVVPSALGTPRTANYRITAPGGTWGRFDNGTYTVSQVADSVSDTAGNARPALPAIGTFNCSISFVWKVGAVLHLEHGPEGTPIGVAPAGSGGANVQASEGATTLSFSGINQIIAHGSSGDDTFEFDGLPDEVITQFEGGGAGNDTLRVRSGTFRFGDELTATSPNLAVLVDVGAHAIFYTRQRLRSLIVNGTAQFSQDSDFTIATRMLSLGPAGQLDLTNKDLIVDPLLGDPTMTAPTVQAYIAAAYDFGSWDLPGLTTSMTDATVNGLTTLAVSPATEVLGISGAETAPWNGHPVSARAVLVKYTYAGDVNFDGFIDASDYGIIDNYFQFPGTTGYWNGDFNFDGIIDAGDYGLIDNAYQLQGLPL